ncbi:biofilm regulation diguanylate cyclase SiaD [Pseudogulbenkiania ferrooxidans]|uniref:diguanylate cyclase n=1 Tax=Pseudogulbenkiania ferrooxidans 2002 TaxID=279714 RepID=B9Z5K2_9NEIS|nr:biofilm regulation diguanylate cyclase SiaD [Pseudogulbenkiania ferrooxidans]EEG07849.1 diguanylate cyclase [Pseudogulbenkiania ferrooxidans 2002]
MKQHEELESRIETLLADPAYADHPLHEALASLFERYREQTRQIERVSRIADRYQDAERDRGLSYAARYQRQLRQVEKIVRISDRYQNMLRDMNQRLHWLSSRDELTGLPNRRHALVRLREELQRLGRSGGQFCLTLADVDHFKSINDGYGHDVGDRVLGAIAHGLSEGVRDYDVCARWGGEEFLLLFPHSSIEEVQSVLVRLRRQVGVLSGELLPAGAAGLTLSFGLTLCRDAAEPLDAILQRADQALYQAKGQGRDCVVIG